MNWTQAVCDKCWKINEDERVPVRITSPEPETCCFCGDNTESGIYIRIDPRTVRFS